MVWIRGRLVTRFLYDFVLKIISNWVLSPTASSFFVRGALVHPQPGITLSIFSNSSPVEYNQKGYDILEFWGTYPKLNTDSLIVSLGAAEAEIDKTKTTRRAVISAIFFIRSIHLSISIYIFFFHTES